MNSATDLPFRNTPSAEPKFQKAISSFAIKHSLQNERKILKAILLGHLHQLFCEIFYTELQCNQHDFLLEYYAMDSKIIQILIQGIIETGEYTIEGIARYTRIHVDVIYDAACGIGNQFSITPWARVVDLYLQVKPDIAQILINKLLELRDKSRTVFSVLLNEK